MNIIIVNDSGNINGGAAKVAIDSTIELSNSKNNVFYFCSSKEIEKQLVLSKLSLLKNLNQSEIKDESNKLNAFIRGIWNLKAYSEMKSLLKNMDKKQTIVHIHGWTKSLTISVIFAALINGFKVVITLHDFFIHCPNGGLFNYKRKSICKIKPLSLNCITTNCDSRGYSFKIFRVIRSIIERIIFLLYKNKIHLIFLSKLSYDVLQPYIYKFNSVSYIENPVDRKKETKVKAETNNIFLFIGRISFEKGCESFCKSISSNSNLKGIVIGEGNEYNYLVEKYPNISFLGWQSKKEIDNILRKTRCLVFPSLWYETYGLVVKEAISIGIPCIVSSSTAACEFIIDNHNGVIFESGNIEDLSKKILILNNDNELVLKLSENAYKSFWSKDHSVKRHTSLLIDKYNHILKF